MKNNDSFQNDPVYKRAQENSNFRAVKVLVQTENTLRAAHNRIRVLEANDNKNKQKIHTQLQTIQKIQRTREAEYAHLALIDSCRDQLERQASENNIRSKMMKSQHLQKIDQVYKEIKEEKKGQYLQTEQNSTLAEKVITESRIRQQKAKQSHRIHINKEEDEAKKRLIQFYETKQSRLKENKSFEIQTLKSKEADRLKKIQQLSKIEMQMIQKQSQSQAAYLEVKNKLDSLLHSVKRQNMNSKKALKPSMHISQGGPPSI